MQQSDTFYWPIRVYYEDTDSGGVVYHANYLNFMERARTEWLRSLGFEQTVLRDHFHVLFVVHSMALQFKSPARFNDMLEVKSTCIKRGLSSLVFKQIIVRDHVILHEAEVKVACVNAASFKPCKIPPAIQQQLASLQAAAKST